MRAALACAVLVALAGAPDTGENELTLEALMQGMATTTGVVADFREVKQIALLSAPIETRGRLYFIPPDRLARVTESPGASRLVIAGERFEFQDEAGGERVSLGSNPMARQFVDNFIVLFNGDLAELRRRYQVDFRAEAEGWQLALTPRHAPLRDVIRSIELVGRGRELREMRLLESDGDTTHTTFGDVSVDHRFSEEENERIFSPRDAP